MKTTNNEYPIILRTSNCCYDLHIAFGQVVGGSTKGMCERYAKAQGLPKPNYRDDRPGNSSTYQSPFGTWN